MKIHFPKFLRVISTLFLLWFGLSLAKYLSFDFALDLRLFFLAFLTPFSLYVLLEAIANRKFLWEFLKSQSRKKKTEVTSRAKSIQKRIVGFSSLFSGDLGKDLALIIGYFISSTISLILFIGKILFSKYNFLFFSLFGILFEIIYIPTSIDAILIFLTLIWVLTIRMFKFKGELSVKIALLLLVLCPYYLGRNQNFMAEKIAVWVFLFLVVGVLQIIWENRKIVE